MRRNKKYRNQQHIEFDSHGFTFTVFTKMYKYKTNNNKKPIVITEEYSL